MKKTIKLISLLFCIPFLMANSDVHKRMYPKGCLRYDFDFLSKKDSVVLLKNSNNQSLVIVSPKYQGRVFTSSAEGLEGQSLGWINYKAIDSDIIDEHINVYGGENRFWLGPEGGQYSIFFKEGVKQNLTNWYTPKGIDVEPWTVISKNNESVTLQKEMHVTNYKDYTLNVGIHRNIRILSVNEIQAFLGNIRCNDLKYVAYETTNRITNKNVFSWSSETGTICMWLLDMFPGSKDAYTVIPYVRGDHTELGKEITSDYFGEIPSDRLYKKESHFIFKTDGKYRSKLGLNPKRTTGVVGNYNFSTRHLIIVVFDVHPDAIYLNQEWNLKRDPQIGDALNAYNDGPLENGKQLGTFFEIESSSQGAFLKPNESMIHKHNVYHFIGEEKSLNTIAKKLLGITLNDIYNSCT